MTHPSFLKWTGAVAVELPDSGTGIQNEHIVRV